MAEAEEAEQKRLGEVGKEINNKLALEVGKKLEMTNMKNNKICTHSRSLLPMRFVFWWCHWTHSVTFLCKVSCFLHRRRSMYEAIIEIL